MPAAGLPNQGFRYYQKEHSRVVLLKSCQVQLKVTSRAGGDCNYVMLVSYDLGLDLLKLPTINQNKGFIIPTFCSPSSDFEVVEDHKFYLPFDSLKVIFFTKVYLPTNQPTDQPTNS